MHFSISSIYFCLLSPAHTRRNLCSLAPSFLFVPSLLASLLPPSLPSFAPRARCEHCTTVRKTAHAGHVKLTSGTETYRYLSRRVARLPDIVLGVRRGLLDIIRRSAPCHVRLTPRHRPRLGHGTECADGSSARERAREGERREERERRRVGAAKEENGEVATLSRCRNMVSFFLPPLLAAHITTPRIIGRFYTSTWLFPAWRPRRLISKKGTKYGSEQEERFSSRLPRVLDHQNSRPLSRWGRREEGRLLKA